jgi:hypothetical protein
MRTEIIVSGHDNRIDLILKENNIALSKDRMSSITKISIVLGVTISSENDDIISWDRSDYSNGEIRMALGNSGITPGRYNSPLFVYSPDNPDGVLWGWIAINVIEDPIIE